MEKGGDLVDCEPMEKGGGGEWLPAAAVMVVWGCLDVGIAGICLGCLGIADVLFLMNWYFFIGPPQHIVEIA